MPRELIAPHKGDKRYVRRGTKGKFATRQAKVGRSLSSDRRSKARLSLRGVRASVRVKNEFRFCCVKPN